MTSFDPLELQMQYKARYLPSCVVLDELLTLSGPEILQL